MEVTVWGVLDSNLKLKMQTWDSLTCQLQAMIPQVIVKACRPLADITIMQSSWYDPDSDLFKTWSLAKAGPLAEVKRLMWEKYNYIGVILWTYSIWFSADWNCWNIDGCMK